MCAAVELAGFHGVCMNATGISFVIFDCGASRKPLIS
jgi:hypothetical protein